MEPKDETNHSTTSMKRKLEEIDVPNNIIKKIKYTKPNYHETKTMKHEKAITCLQFSKNGEYLATGCKDTFSKTISASDKTIKIWRTIDFSLHQTLIGHLDGVCDISWNNYTTLICSGSDDGTIRIWSVKTGECLTILKGHDQFVYSVTFNTQGNLIASGSFDETIKIWEVQTGKEVKTLTAHSEPVTSVCFNKDGTLLLSSSYDGLTRIWDTHSGQCLKTLLLRDDNISVGFSEFSPNGKYILATSLDSMIYLLDYVSCKRVKKFKGHLNQKFCIFCCFCDEYIISGSEDNFIYIWDIQTKEVLQKISGHSKPVLAVDSFSNDKVKLLASGSIDGIIKIFKNE
eukprot:gene5079-8679_t